MKKQLCLLSFTLAFMTLVSGCRIFYAFNGGKSDAEWEKTRLYGKNSSLKDLQDSSENERIEYMTYIKEQAIAAEFEKNPLKDGQRYKIVAVSRSGGHGNPKVTFEEPGEIVIFTSGNRYLKSFQYSSRYEGQKGFSISTTRDPFDEVGIKKFKTKALGSDGQIRSDTGGIVWFDVAFTADSKQMTLRGYDSYIAGERGYKMLLPNANYFIIANVVEDGE